MENIFSDLKDEVELKVINHVHYLILNKKANAFTQQFIRKIHSKLDIIEKYEGPLALVTISTQKNLFSAGLDLNFMATANESDIINFLLEFARLIGRFSVFPCPTIALIDGTCMAGGLALAMAHDYRIATEISKFSMNEISLNMPIPSGIFATLKHKIPNKYLKKIVITGFKFDAQEAEKLQVIDSIIAKTNIFQEVVKMAEKLSEFGQNRLAQHRIKMELYRELLQDCFQRGLENGINFQYQAQKPKF